jgi:hypothetical protein
VTYQSYSKGIKYIFIAFVPLYFLQYGKDIIADLGVPFVYTINYFVLRLLALFLLFFSAYAFLSKIKEVRKLESPIIFVIIGLLLVVLLFGLPIYLYVHTTKIAFTHGHLQPQEVKEVTLNSNNNSFKRFQFARDYYLDSGGRLPYLDDKNKERLFTPDARTQKVRESQNFINAFQAKFRISALILIGILAGAVLGFVVFLWFHFPKQVLQNKD